MMQPCASAAKFRSGGSILHRGLTAILALGAPPPWIVIGPPLSRLERAPNAAGVIGSGLLDCRAQDNAVRSLAGGHHAPQRDHVVDNVAQAASDFVLIVSCDELRLRGGRANAAGLKPSSRPGLARPVEEGGDNDPAAAQAWPTAQPRGGL